MRHTIISLCVCIFLLVAVCPASGKEDTNQYQIVFSTFEKDGAGDYGYLRDSVQAMLASRLATRDRVEVLEKTFSSAELNALKQAEKAESLTVGGVKADYLVTGSLFSLVSGLNIQVVLYPLVPEKEVLRFSILSSSPEKLLADVDQLSRDIAEEAFGYPHKIAGEGEIEGGSDGFVTVHPEAAYKKSLYSGTVIGLTGSSLQAKARGMKKSTTIPRDMQAMAVGDVDGDGVEEIFLLMRRELKVFHVKDRKIEEQATLVLSPHIVRHAISLADIDGDSVEEICLSGTDGLYVSSTILRWSKERGGEVVAAHLPYYLRPLYMPEKGWQLVGQKRGTEKTDLIRPGVYQLRLAADGKIREGQRLPLPRGINLFDFTYADIDGDRSQELIVVDQREKIKIYNDQNQLVWVSKRNYGGSKTYFGPSVSGAVDENNRRNFTPDEDSSRELIFVPGRVVATDVDLDGRDEIIINENDSSPLNFFKRLRIYSGGAVVGLSWNGAELKEVWRTGNFRGYIAGFDFTAIAGEAKVTQKGVSAGRLYVGHLPKSGSLAELLPGSGETELTVYDMEFSVDKTE